MSCVKQRGGGASVDHHGDHGDDHGEDCDKNGRRVLVGGDSLLFRPHFRPPMRQIDSSKQLIQVYLFLILRDELELRKNPKSNCQKPSFQLFLLSSMMDNRITNVD